MYESEPFGVGDDEQPMYLNMVVSIQTKLEPEKLLSELMDIERANGRVRIRRNESRTLDLDVLMFGEELIETSVLAVPHPRMHERAFVMLPLAEIAPAVRCIPTSAFARCRRLRKELPNRTGHAAGRQDR